MISRKFVIRFREQGTELGSEPGSRKRALIGVMKSPWCAVHGIPVASGYFIPFKKNLCRSDLNEREEETRKNEVG